MNGYENLAPANDGFCGGKLAPSVKLNIAPRWNGRSPRLFVPPVKMPWLVVYIAWPKKNQNSTKKNA